jgi:hypothetical protein
MALPASGPLSLGDIATEMGVSLSNVSLTTQSTTGINQNSPSKPNGVAPHFISEFYGYDQSASSLTEFTVDETFYESAEGACSEGSETSTWYHDGGDPYPVAGDNVYTDSGGTTSPEDGFYWMDVPSSFEIGGGQVQEVIEC